MGVRPWHHILQEMGLAGTLGWRPVSWRVNWSATHRVQPPGPPPLWTVGAHLGGHTVLGPRVRDAPRHSPRAQPATILYPVVRAGCAVNVPWPLHHLPPSRPHT